MKQHVELNPIARQKILSQFLNGTLETPVVFHSKNRLWLDRNKIETLETPSSLFIQEIDPTPASLAKGYRHGHVVLTYHELIATFGKHFNTQSWEKFRCYHMPTPPQKMQPYFIASTS